MKASKWIVMFSLPLMTAACANATSTAPTDGDARDASFMVDGQADSFGVAEGSQQALAVLKLVNGATLPKLDDQVGLDSRAAHHIVDYRAGADTKLGTSDDQKFGTLQELDDVPWVGPRAFGKLLLFASQSPADTKTPVNGYEPGSHDAKAILVAANTLDEATLDDAVALDHRAATNIVSYRMGDDGTAGTSDDRTFDTLHKLDMIKYVGQSAFDHLHEYSLKNKLLGPDDGPRDGESTDPFDASFCTGDGMTVPQAAGHFPGGASRVSLGTATWHTRTRTCNSLTGCSPWTVKDNTLNADLGLDTIGHDVHLTVSDVPINQRSVACNGTKIGNIGGQTCVAYDQRWQSTTYHGTITDHCAKVDNVTKTDPNDNSSWNETETVLAVRFAPTPERNFQSPNVPSEDAENDSPFSAHSCDAAVITQEEALTHFDPGTNSTAFGSGEWSKRVRTCNVTTGCGEWDSSQGFLATDSTLNVINSKLFLGLSDVPINQRSVSCNSTPVTGGQVSCVAYDQRWQSTTYKGRVTAHCTRLENVTTESPNTANGSYQQTQTVYFQNN